MSAYLTSDTLIASVKRKAQIPANQATFQDEDFLAFANEELKMSMVPLVISAHEEFYVYVQSTPLVSNKAKYEVPYRALGGRLRDLFFQDVNGNLVEMSRISPDDKSIFQGSFIGNRFMFYYVEGNNVVLTPGVNETVTGSLVFSYYIRPNDMVVSSRVAEIQSIAIDGLNTVYTVDVVPSGFSTSTKMDLLQAKPGHKIRKFDILPQAISTTNKTVTFLTADIDSETEVLDHIAFAGECMIPQCPTDLHSLLAQKVTARCLEALGDTQGLTNANAKLQEMQVNTQLLIDNRIDGSVKKVVNNRGILQQSKIRRRRGWY